MSDPVEHNLPRRRLGSLNRVLLRVTVQEDVQFRHFGNPTPIDFAVKRDHELHSQQLTTPGCGAVGEARRGAGGWGTEEHLRGSLGVHFRGSFCG